MAKASEAWRYGPYVADQVGDRLPGREALCGFTQLLGLDSSVYPAIKDLDHDRAWLKALGSNRANSVRGYLCLRIHYLHQDTSYEGYRAGIFVLKSQPYAPCR